LIELYRVDASGLKDDPVRKPAGEFDKDISENIIPFGDSVYSTGAMNYLLKRKLDVDLISKMGIHLGTNRLFGRVVFLDQKNRYYVARAFLKGLDPKTLNPPSGTSGKPLMYFTKREYDTLYLVEGCFDSVPFLKTNRSAVCVLGKDVSADQMKQLKSVLIKTIIIALDSDAFDGAKRLAQRIADELPLTNIGVLMYDDREGKDPSDYDVELFTKTSIYWVRIMSQNCMLERV
jgi:hypothetical protein